MTRYEENFKQMIVELNQTGRSVQGLAKEYGLSEATIYKWKKSNTTVTGSSLTPAQIKQMEKEMTRLRQENEILKKAMAIFTK